MKAYLDAQGFDEVVTLLDDQVTPEAFRYPQRYLEGQDEGERPVPLLLLGPRHHRRQPAPGATCHCHDEKDDNRHAKSIPMLDLVVWLKGLNVQHLFVVLDSCFAGLAIDGTEMKGTVTQPDPKVDREALHRMARGPARYLIMAGDRDQAVVRRAAMERQPLH